MCNQQHRQLQKTLNHSVNRSCQPYQHAAHQQHGWQFQVVRAKLKQVWTAEIAACACQK